MCNILRDDGITFHEYMSELATLLFLKMAKETKEEPGLPEGCRWDDLRGKGDKTLDVYKRMLLQLGETKSKQLNLVFSNTRTEINRSESLISLVNAIDSLDWFSAKREGLGDIYEGLLEKNATEKRSGAGQYFTPRALIESIVSLVKPAFEEVVLDPAAGTGGFLVAADQWARMQLSDENVIDSRPTRLIGIELVADVHRLAVMNMLLHGLKADFRLGDALVTEPPKCNVILTNPPFGTKKSISSVRGNLQFPTSNKQFAFLQYIISCLRPGGRAAVIFSDNVLFENGKGTEIRRHLMSECNLHTILRLPQGIFYSTGVKTNVMFFTKISHEVKSTSSVWVYDLRTGAPPFGRTSQISRDHLREFEIRFGADPLGRNSRADEGEAGRFRSFSRAEIAARGDLSWLSDVGFPNDESPDGLLVQATDSLSSALMELDSVRTRLKEISSTETGEIH